MIASLFLNAGEYELRQAAGARHAEEFRKAGIVIFPHFFSCGGFLLLLEEVRRLRSSSTRRDFLMEESGNTPRKMSTVGGHRIAAGSTLIPLLYRDLPLLHFLSGVAGEEVLPVPDTIENHVLNFLDQPGDTHGAHTDTYPYAFNTLLECPDPGEGGELQMAFGSRDIKHLDNGEAKTIPLHRGDCYFMRTDENAHRVSPLRGAGARAVINFAYTDRKALKAMSYSSSLLYG